MKQEEDFDANLAGEDGPAEESKTSWFKRIKKGITTSTAEKKRHLKDSGQNARNVIIYAPCRI